MFRTRLHAAVLLLLALQTAGALRILSLNMWTPVFGGGPNAKQRMEALMAEVGSYDVVALQEVFNLHLFHASIVGYATWLDTEFKQRGFNYTVLPLGINDVFTVQDDGLFLASRFPLRRTTQSLFSSPLLVDWWMRKGFQITVIDAPGSQLVLTNTHLHAEEGKRDADIRFNQMLELSLIHI